MMIRCDTQEDGLCLREKYTTKMNDRYIIYTKDLVFEDGVLYMPIYMAMFL